jgi:hypothetical protein
VRFAAADGEELRARAGAGGAIPVSGEGEEVRRVQDVVTGERVELLVRGVRLRRARAVREAARAGRDGVPPVPAEAAAQVAVPAAAPAVRAVRLQHPFLLQFFCYN